MRRLLSSFGEHLTKKKVLPGALHKTLLGLYESRVTSDYSVEDIPSAEETRDVLNAAHEFVVSVERYLEQWLIDAVGE